MDILKLTLPLPPSINHYYVTNQRGQRVKSGRADAWMFEAGLLVKDAARKQGWGYSEKEKLVMYITVYWPDNRRRDTHNLHKALCDAPEGIAYKDDKWVLVRDRDFAVDRENPRVEIEIERAGI